MLPAVLYSLQSQTTLSSQILPTVSVIIATYNRAGLLPDAVRSVLNQSFADTEVIIVDDGSTDDTERVVQTLGERITYIRQPKSGAATARNLGILHAKGEFVLFLDSDDVILPTALEKLVAALRADPEAGAAYCGWVSTDAPGSIYRRSPLHWRSGWVFEDMCTRYISVIHSILIRRDCFARAGMFDTRLTHFEDLDLNTRLAAHYKWVFVPEHLVEYRKWQEGISVGDDRLAEDQRLYMEKMGAFVRAGKLSWGQWLAIRQHVLGPVSKMKRRYRHRLLPYVRSLRTFIKSLGTIATRFLHLVQREPRRER